MNRLLCATLTAAVLLLGSPAQAEVRKDRIELAEGHPTEYVVVKGDTLWDISGRFLKSPWLWPDVWYVNPQIDNPHLIYPGDIIYLTWVDGQPRLSLKRGIRKLSPQARVTPLDQAIPAIPLKDIAGFLNDNIVMEQDLLERAPYVIGGKNERIIAGSGDRVYARGEPVEDVSLQGIYRPAKAYNDPFTNELLGYELYRVADGRITARDSGSQVLTMDLLDTNEEVRVRDRVVPNDESRIESVFYPSAGPQLDNAVIMDVLGGVAKIGQFDAVTLNVGAREGLEVGNVFAVFNKGETVKDPVTEEMITLPSEKAGTLMVFKVFDKVSYGLVMRATNVISVGDSLQSP
ncbi:LysM peptidoglycan-binding domain-containing protein [Marinobacterium sp. D7]|uniref:LysM peptidoglycan-binding domain-containing protein n=1 Tax=Marinobacterium ramblicola TaxID=2849041 RepID=UPI001C2D5E65|nr:LysM peptidoglycan-binding domain-containing protein [Marinobacterium ramblicola]MBV1789310.1 LysM peptidoglycan-binding domain-containing protein [Marinobacterium ramblicola]